MARIFSNRVLRKLFPAFSQIFENRVSAQSIFSKLFSVKFHEFLVMNSFFKYSGAQRVSRKLEPVKLQDYLEKVSGKHLVCSTRNRSKRVENFGLKFYRTMDRTGHINFRPKQRTTVPIRTGVVIHSAMFLIIDLSQTFFREKGKFEYLEKNMTF